MQFEPGYTASVRYRNDVPYIVLAMSSYSTKSIWLTFDEWRALQIDGNRAMNAVVMAESGREVSNVKRMPSRQD